MAHTTDDRDDIVLTEEESTPNHNKDVPKRGGHNTVDNFPSPEQSRKTNGLTTPPRRSQRNCPGSPSSEEERRTWARRAVGQMTVGGVRHSMLTLTSTALGGGLLAVSYVMKECGLGLGLCMLVIGAILAYLSTIILMRISHEIGHYTYAGLFSYCVGPRGGPVLDAMLFVYGNGSCVGYFVFLGDFIPALVNFIAPGAPAWASSKLLAIAVCAVVISPMVLARDTSAALRHLTPVSLVSLMYVSLVIAIRSPFQFRDHQGDATYGEVKAFNFSWNIFSSFAICIFAYNCHINVVPVAEKLVRPTKARIQKVSWRVNALQVCFYSLIGVTGYITFLEKTPQDVLEGFDAKDYYMAVARFLLTFTMIVGIPMNLNPTVKSALQFIDYFRKAEDSFLESSPSGSPAASPPSSPRTSPRDTYGRGQTAPERGAVVRITISLACLVVQAAIAVVVPGVADVISLLGATVATAMMLVIPAHAMHKVMEHKFKYTVQKAVLGFFAVASLISVPIKILTMAKVIDLSQSEAVHGAALEQVASLVSNSSLVIS